MTVTSTASESVAAEGAVDPVTGLTLYELSHEWGHGAPAHPGFADVQINRQANHAEHGVTSQRIRTVMHTGTHVNAPLHLLQGAPGIGALPLDRFFGSGVIIDAPKNDWELVSVQDLESAEIHAKDIVVIVTGWHRHYADSQKYFAHAPGLDPEAARWMIERNVKLVAMDTPNIDHPLATSLGNHRGGPRAKYLVARYEATMGRRAFEDFPAWNPAHRALLAAGMPTIESVGGDVGALLGCRATLVAFPWSWPTGDACQVRFVALTDPSGTYRLNDQPAK